MPSEEPAKPGSTKQQLKKLRGLGEAQARQQVKREKRRCPYCGAVRPAKRGA